MCISKTSHTIEQLSQAFGMILLAAGKRKRGVLDWEAPIRVVIPHPGCQNLDCAAEAITFFTGAIPTITDHRVGERHMVCITSSGHDIFED